MRIGHASSIVPEVSPTDSSNSLKENKARRTLGGTLAITGAFLICFYSCSWGLREDMSRPPPKENPG